MAQAHERETALANRIEERIDKGFTRDIGMLGSGSGAMFVPQSLGELMEFSKMMAVAGSALPKHLRANPGACMAVAMQAFRWGFDPFAVGQKSYSVNDIIAYESQLINAVVNTIAPMKTRPTIKYEGDGQDRVCIVSGTIIGEDEAREVTSPKLKDISPKNSPLWKTDPDQQLAYYTTRTWARRHVPEVLLGVYAEDEIDNFKRSEQARDVTPAAPSAPQAPTRHDFNQSAAVIDAAIVETKSSDLVAYLTKALEEASTQADLTEIWSVAGRDGDLDAIRKTDRAALARLSTIYNTRSAIFDEGRIAAEEMAEASNAGVNGEASHEPADEDEETTQQSPSQSENATTDDDEATRERELTTQACVRALSHFNNAKAINNWFNTTFQTDAEKNGLTEAQIKRVTEAKDKRLAEFQ